ncbi:uncharacterized protein LOC126681910 [Mercurialis annua]|uniref:uncharacterized protein LOC126681910 n=1 Tax=Mercurialis annua TaxID=3986 RepID=UPI00215F03E3|nr:uncharacterized protein LOC126681910 [Mercurialis annua]
MPAPVVMIKRNTDAKISDVIRNGCWSFPDAMDDVTLHAWEFIQRNFVIIDLDKDKIIFKLVKNDMFSIKAAWNFLSPEVHHVSWYALLWKPPVVPRHSFITWLAIHNGLKTRDKLFRWGSVPNPNCVLCNGAVETVKHLFFDCPFSCDVWKRVLLACRINRGPLRLCREVSWFTRNRCGRNIRHRLSRIAFCSSVYCIWQERNRIIFKDITPSQEDVFSKISLVLLCKFQGRVAASNFGGWL